MKKRNAQFFICGIAKLSVSVFFFLTAAFISKDLKSQTPFAVELYHTQGLGIPMAQAAPFTGRGGFAAASVGENVQVTVGEGRGTDGKKKNVYFCKVKSEGLQQLSR